MWSRSTVSRIILLLVVGGCGNDPLAPFEPEITNATDSFQLQASDVRSVTRTFTYTWRNTGTIANVNHSTTTSQGSARLIIRAANGAQVYDRSLVPSLNEASTAGTSGDWTIQLVLSGYRDAEFPGAATVTWTCRVVPPIEGRCPERFSAGCEGGRVREQGWHEKWAAVERDQRHPTRGSASHNTKFMPRNALRCLPPQPMKGNR